MEAQLHAQDSYKNGIMTECQSVMLFVSFLLKDGEFNIISFLILVDPAAGLQTRVPAQGGGDLLAPFLGLAAASHSLRTRRRGR